MSGVLWRTLVAEAVDRLLAAGNENSNNEARWIAQEVTGADDSEWQAKLDTAATARQVAGFDAALERRLDGEPLQYVLNRWPFRHLDLFVDRRVLIPRPETEIMVDLAIAEIDRIVTDAETPLLVADLGTGSGAIGLAIASETANVSVWLTDSSQEALVVAAGNLASLGIRGGNVRIAQGDWFDALDPALIAQFDVIVSNPPYVAASDDVENHVIDWEPHRALFAGERGVEMLEHLVVSSPMWLKQHGVLMLEMAPNQVEEIAELARRYFGRVETHQDYNQRPRIVIAKTPRQR